MIKNWQIKEKISAAELAKHPEINPLVLQLLYNRQLTSASEIESFLNPNYEGQVMDPYLFKDMKAAVDRLFAAISAKEKVMIYGDYDADGVCSTVLLYNTLVALGLEVETYIPFRESEGYGLNMKVSQQIIDQEYKLLITVDCGIANAKEIELFNENKVNVIVLDHHEEPLARPQALAIINSTLADSGYPFNRLCGAGVVFKFIQAIIARQKSSDSAMKLPEGFDKWLLDLVALATVGDIVPLVNENRVFVKYGLVVLEKTRNPGLKKMIETVNNRTGKFDSEYLGWRLVPRLNAAGRINHASVAFNLLTAKNEDDALKWVEILEEHNRERQQTTEKLMEQAMEQVSKKIDTDNLLIVWGDGWPAGLVGLIAGKICDRYHRPALVFGREKDNEGFKYVGSGRSIKGFDITMALKDCHEFLARFGGHPQACGLTIIGDKNFNDFMEKMAGIAENKLNGIDLTPALAIDAEISLAEINWQLLDELEKFEPFGEGNAKPIFCATKLIVEQIQTVGADGKHLKVLVSQKGSPKIHKLIGFSFGDWCAQLSAGQEIDIIFELGVNEWNGNREIQLKIVDLKKSE